VCGINSAVAASFEGLGVIEHLPNHIRYTTRLAALSAARDWIFENTTSRGESDASSPPGGRAAA
jgi:hypothetical protein